MRFLQPLILWYRIAFLCIPKDDRKESCTLAAMLLLASSNHGMEVQVWYGAIAKTFSLLLQYVATVLC